MKKLLSLMLALCMLCGAVAFAGNYTDEQNVAMNLTLTIAAVLDGTFEVEIPTDVSFGAAQTNESGNTYYEANTAVNVTKNETEQNVVVYIGNTESTLLDGEKEIAYSASEPSVSGSTGEGVAVAAPGEDGGEYALVVPSTCTGEFALSFTTEAKAASEFEAGNYADGRNFRIVLE